MLGRLRTCKYYHSMLFCSSKTLKISRLRAKLNLRQHEEDYPLFHAAVSRASLRFQETNSPEPLFVDPYATSFVPLNVQMDAKHHLHHYCLATKFIDDKLLDVTNDIDGVKQVVLLIDGMDSRPYRLNWHYSTIIFDISPEKVFSRASQELDGGLRFQEAACSFMFHWSPLTYNKFCTVKDLAGNRASIWALQGLPVMNLASFKEIISLASSLAMKGCLFMGELPVWLAETEIRTKSTTKEWLDNLFRSYGFLINVIGYDEVARTYARDLVLGEYKNLLFVAEHLRLSDDQMETWRREFQRLEEEADEEGFEEL